MSVLTRAIGKYAQLAKDPILRRWVVTRLLRGAAISPMPPRQCPPYLAGQTLAAASPLDSPDTASPASPDVPIALTLAGLEVEVQPEAIADLFERTFDDMETSLALHRFAWLRLMNYDVDPRWFGALWQAWCARYAQDVSGWAWHPYTAAERAINVLAYLRRHARALATLPHRSALSAHGPAIFTQLEYYGEHHTGNHLANNGRGLYIGGLESGHADWVEAGLAILLREADRIFTRSGVLREGSSHYHQLCSSWYLDTWLAARRHGRPEAAVLRDIAGRCLNAARGLALSGGLPLVGDVSPDCPPAFLECLLSHVPHGWRCELSAGERMAFDQLRDTIFSTTPPDLATDGWLRLVHEDWSLLAHASPIGWAFTPGHGHRDYGGFELHSAAEPLFVDLGRRSYGASGSVDVAAQAHNTLAVDGEEAYPANKPYYTDDFRKRMAPPPDTRRIGDAALTMTSGAFGRLKGLGTWRRDIALAGPTARIRDSIEGSGRRRILRYLHTTQDVRQDGNGLAVGPVRLEFEGTAVLHPATRWIAYGRGEAATSIEISIDATLPWTSELKISLR